MGCLLEVAQSDIDAAQCVQAVGPLRIGGMVFLQCFQCILLRLFVLLLVIEPFCSPVPNLLLQGVGRGLCAKRNRFIGKFCFRQFIEELVGNSNIRMPVELLQDLLYIVLSP